MSLFLESIQQANYTVFVIRNKDVEDEQPISAEKISEIILDENKNKEIIEEK